VVEVAAVEMVILPLQGPVEVAVELVQLSIISHCMLVVSHSLLVWELVELVEPQEHLEPMDLILSLIYPMAAKLLPMVEAVVPVAHCWWQVAVVVAEVLTRADHRVQIQPVATVVLVSHHLIKV
jgi:hypothetical protein